MSGSAQARIAVLLTICFTLGVVPMSTFAAAESASAPQGLTVSDDGVLLKDGAPYRGIGVNYFDAFGRTFDDPTDPSYRKGFSQLRERGIPFARFMACGFWPVQMKQYVDDKDAYLARLDDVVKAAEENGIGLIPSLCWYWACVPDLVGEPCNSWGDPESKTIAFMREYTREVVTRYVDSPAIWAWEIGNEFMLGVDLPNAAEHRPWIWPHLGTATTRTLADDPKTEHMLVAYREFGKTVREIDPVRVITSGDASPRSNSWRIRTTGGWFPHDTREEFAATLTNTAPSPMNMTQIHYYEETREARFGDDKPMTPLAFFNLCAAESRKQGKALFIGEFGICPLDVIADPDERKRLFFETLEAIEKSDVPLAALWVFDYTNPTKIASQDQRNASVGGKQEYILDAISEANRRMQAVGLYEKHDASQDKPAMPSSRSMAQHGVAAQ